MTDCGELYGLISPEELAKKILEEEGSPDPSFLVIDVRDVDHIGGHIKGHYHAPMAKFDDLLPHLVHMCRDKKTLIFHCLMSQQRGPTAAREYIFIREKMLCILMKEGRPDQEVLVLDGGFYAWMQHYAEDERLTSSFVSSLWRND
ncbi:Rhodanese-like protein [Moelleriella libera RCEF 2490]|uniref:Rhodanese-like protein n=1 Tax=Moelleriella libera RCEF 2490 TaxID=1081109 RepID=A0A168F9E4_9HYPO|nr:Rhodanese-like protein [Moelleriella libera RCEF 2490]